MNPAAIPKKTDLGRAAMLDKSVTLSRLARTALIMIDGLKTTDAVLKVLPATRESAQEAIQELLAAGCITIIEGTTTVPVQVAAPVVSPSVLPSAFGDSTISGDWTAVRKDSVRRLGHAFGPLADDICMELERSKDVQQLRAALERAAQIVKNLKNANAADEFLAATRDRLG
jgi:hypothetical protein